MPTPIDNLQPSVAITEAILTAGNYPSVGGGGSQGSIAAIRHFAFNFAPAGTAGTHGQLLPISQNTAFFSLLGTTYGGDGVSNFALPDLDTRLSVGTGPGPGLTDHELGELFGVDDLFLIRSNMLANLGGFSDPLVNSAPSLAARYVINAYGTYNGGELTDIGMVWEFAGTFVPGGTLECNGQLVLITEYETLFNLIGTTYGGDGQTTFAMPDLRGRAIVGSSNGGGDLGTLFGTETQTIGAVNLPSEMGGGAQPLDNHGPSLVLRYMIALQGIFPSQSGSPNAALDGQTPVLGEIVATAGNSIPNGWAECNGQLLAINQNQALFALLGTMYGGNGQTTFALPDLRGRALVGADSPSLVGTIYGDDLITLTLDNIPDLYVTGTANIDTLFGANEADSIFGLGDNDTLTGHGGNDYLDGGGGDDTMRGGLGDDAYVVDSLGDVVEENSGEGTDTVFTALAAYSIGGLANVENLTGTGNVNQTLTGNTGNNRIDGGLGVDLMAGGLGNDTYIVDNFGDVASENAGEGTDTVLSSITVSLGAEVENLTLTGLLAINGSGNGLNNIITGNSAANLLSGGAGNDSLLGGGGNDYMLGGAGTDVLQGEGGNDRLDGGLGDDTLVGGAGLDEAYYGSATAGVTVNLSLGGAQDTGGAGVDTLSGLEQLSGSTLDDTLTGDSGINAIAGGNGNDAIDGGLGNDTLIGDYGNDTILGGEGDDRLDGGGGEDVLDGGDGIDTANYTTATRAVTVDLSVTGFQDTIGWGADSLVGIENLIGSSGADTLSGNSGANTIIGRGGNDIISGAGGNDRLDGGFGLNTLAGGDGIDTIYYNNAQSGVTVNLATGQTNWAGGIDTLTGIEQVVGSSSADTLTGNGGINAIAGGDGNDAIDGGLGNDTLIGDAGNDSLSGGEGSDLLNGGLGDDLLDGGNGLDTATYISAAAAVTVDLALAGAQNTLGAGSDTLTAIENLVGSAFADTLSGNGDANTLTGGAGNDAISGAGGHDRLDGGLGDDALNGGDGVDTVYYTTAAAGVTVNLSLAGAQNTVGAGVDTLTGVEQVSGSAFADTLTGNATFNAIVGGNGDDTIAGAAGNDTLTGGGGGDIFRFDTALNAATNVDRLSDFSAADDSIHLAQSIFSAIAASGTLDAAAFQLGTAANDAGDRIVYDSATGRIYYDADGDGAGAQVLFARVAVGTTLSNLDFVVEAPPAAEAPKTADEPPPIGLRPVGSDFEGLGLGGFLPAEDGRTIPPADYLFV